MVGGIISAGFTAAEGAALQRAFAALGEMTGKTKAEIIAAVGPPNSISELAGGETLLQWQSAGYHIAIRFQGEVFAGISHEYLANT